MVGPLDALGPIGSGIGAVTSIAGGIYSAIKGSQDARRIKQIQQQMATTQGKENNVRETAMELASRRQETQNIRSAQLARSMAMNTATEQGAQKGSVVGGAFGGIMGQFGTNALATSQSLQTGRQTYELNNELSGEKMQLSNAQADMQADQAFGKMLGGIGGSLGDLGKIGSSLPGIWNSLSA